MPYQIKFDNPPAGYAARSTPEGGEAPVIYCEFLSSEDGMILIKRLEDFVNPILEKVSPQVLIKPSMIDHLLLHFDREGNGTVYINELSQVGKAKLKKNVEAGQAIYNDDIVDFTHLEFQGINIPDDHGVLVLFSQGWRKGLYFDYGPIHPQGQPRGYELSSVLGQYYNYTSSASGSLDVLAVFRTSV